MLQELNWETLASRRKARQTIFYAQTLQQTDGFFSSNLPKTKRWEKPGLVNLLKFVARSYGEESFFYVFFFPTNNKWMKLAPEDIINSTIVLNLSL